MGIYLPKNIGFLVFDNIQPIDLFGPLDAFAEANSFFEDSKYNLYLISESGGKITTETGIQIETDYSIYNAPDLHTLIIPGGSGARSETIEPQVIEWITSAEPFIERLCSVCTGLYILAQTGLLDGRKVTSHWNFIDDIQKRFPTISLRPNNLYIKSGKFMTAAGITSGIDMTLSLIEEDLGIKIASNVAKMLVVYLRRSGGQDQFSTLLQHQEREEGRFSDLMNWIANNLDSDLSTKTLAEKMYFCERHFVRKFKENFGEPPSKSIERIRIEIAKDKLMSGKVPISLVSQQVGFKSSDSFRRCFKKIVGISPSQYQERFGHN